MGIHGGGQQKGGLGPPGGPCENRDTQGSNINVTNRSLFIKHQKYVFIYFKHYVYVKIRYL